MKTLNKNNRFLKLLFLITVLISCVNISISQPVLPQRSLTASATQGIHFGTFCLTGISGGTVTLGWDGSRSSTGNIALLTMSPSAHPAIFEIKLCEGRNMIITFDAFTTLTGSDGGSLTLDIGPTEKGPNGASFSTNSDCNFITPLRVGGILHIPGAAVPGTYTGSFAVTVNQQ